MASTRRFFAGYLFLVLAVLMSATLFPQGHVTATPPAIEAAGLPGPATSEARGTPVLSCDQATELQVGRLLSRLPGFFIENQGQLDHRVKFYTRAVGKANLLFAPEGVSWVFPPITSEAAAGRTGGKEQAAPQPVVVHLTPVGMRPGVEVIGLLPQPGKINHFINENPKTWRTNIPTYEAVLYREAYPGIDLKFYDAGEHLEYDIIIKPGANPEQVAFRLSGVQALRFTPEGDLVIKLPGGGELVQRKPVIYQEIAGRRIPREGEFRLAQDAPDVYSVAVAAYDPSFPLIIDPVLVFSTYLGGTSSGSDPSIAYGVDVGAAIAVDLDGNVYIAGTTNSNNFPRRWPLQSSRAGSSDVFVTKLSNTGHLLYSTYLGGSGVDEGAGIAVDRDGNAYVTGYTDSDNFPTTRSAFQRAKAGGVDAFVFKLNPAGSELVYSTYLGGSGNDFAAAIAVDRSGNAYVTGQTNSQNFPLRHPSQGNNAGGFDAFVTKLDAKGTYPVYSTYVGGSNTDAATGIAVDRGGFVFVTGETNSDNFPCQNARQPHRAGGIDAFVTRINPAGSAFVYSTYLGGSGDDRGQAIAVDQDSNAYVTGYTLSTDFPVHAACQSAPGGGEDGFVTKITADGSNFPYSTYWGGRSDDRGQAIAVDQAGQAYVTGSTYSANFPIKDPIQQLKGNEDVFVTKFKANGGGLLYSTYLGGGGRDRGLGIALDQEGSAYITGSTTSNDFPIKNAGQSQYGGGVCDAFVTKIK